MILKKILGSREERIKEIHDFKEGVFRVGFPDQKSLLLVVQLIDKGKAIP